MKTNKSIELQYIFHIDDEIQTWDQLVKVMNNDTYDVVASFWGVDEKRMNSISQKLNNIRFAYPNIQKGDVLILPKNFERKRNRYFFLNPFSTGVWLIILLILIVGTLLRFGIELFQRKVLRSTEKVAVVNKFPLIASSLLTWISAGY